MKTKQLEKITNHGLNLIEYFNLPADTDPVKLCKQLRRLEIKAHRLSTDDCNGNVSNEDFNIESEKIAKSLRKVLKADDLDSFGVFHNSDARGYALKIDDSMLKQSGVNMERDWGGFGLLAPEIN